MEWLNEPPQWTRGGSMIRLEVEPETDFWRKTHDGGVRDNGHFYFERAEGDFSAQVRLSAEYSAQYDQAGLMVRLDETTWLKCGIEYVDGVQFASTVVTRDLLDKPFLDLVVQGAQFCFARCFKTHDQSTRLC